MSKLIALDAGHGINTYPPSKGVPGMAEFEFNSAVVRYAIPHFERNGFRILLTQPLNGNDTPLTARTNLANSRNADLLLSFHADYNGNSAARGHWGFYWHNSAPCKTLATLWAEEIAKATGSHNRGVLGGKIGEWTNFHMIRESKMPAVLMEHGFMSNADDLAQLKSDKFRRQCAEASARAVCRYFGQAFKAEQPSPPASVPTPPAPTPQPPKKEEPFMLEKAIVIGSFADYPNAELLANYIKAPIYTRRVATTGEFAKELFVVGGNADGLKAGKVTVLSGKDRYQTAQKVNEYLGGGK